MRPNIPGGSNRLGQCRMAEPGRAVGGVRIEVLGLEMDALKCIKGCFEFNLTLLSAKHLSAQFTSMQFALLVLLHKLIIFPPRDVRGPFPRQAKGERLHSRKLKYLWNDSKDPQKI